MKYMMMMVIMKWFIWKNSDKGFFEKIRKIWNKITELRFTDNAPDFVKTTVYDDEECIKANILRNTNFFKSTCNKDKIIIVLHSVVNKNLKTLLELINYNIIPNKYVVTMNISASLSKMTQKKTYLLLKITAYTFKSKLKNYYIIILVVCLKQQQNTLLICRLFHLAIIF